MKYKYLDNEYQIIVIRKKNKNTYIRIDDNLNIVVTTSFFTPDFTIKKMIEKNSTSVNKMLNKKKMEKEKDYGKSVKKIFTSFFFIKFLNLTLFKNENLSRH